MYEFDFHAPRTWQEAFSLLDTPRAQVIAGGTDLIPLLRSQEAQPRLLIDLHRLPDLQYIQRDDGRVQIGATATHADLAGSALCASCAPALMQAARSIGSPQIRNRGTLGGNIVTASPAGDTLPPLLALSAMVTLVSKKGQRRLPLEQLLAGPGQTTLADGEILASIEFPSPPEDADSAFLKIGRRNAVAISVASVAVVLCVEEGVLRSVRVAAGAVAPRAVRCRTAEQLLEGSPLNEDTLLTAASAMQAEIEPITDLRASAHYRRIAAGALLKRAVVQAAQLCQARQNSQARD